MSSLEINQNGFDLERERSSCQLSLEKPRIWEFLTASLEGKSSFQNRDFENFASLESRICEDLVYIVKFFGTKSFKLAVAVMWNWFIDKT